MTRKNLFLMVALTLLVFAGQASAQGPSVSLRHVPDAGGTEGIVSGQGTTFTVRVWSCPVWVESLGLVYQARDRCNFS